MMTRRRVLALLGLTMAASGCGARVVPAQPALLAPGRMALPARLAIPALELDVRIAPVGLADDGAMDVPGAPEEVGWYELGPRPGERGNAVLAGHNVWNGRPGAFAGLGRLKVGDRVLVTTSGRQRFPYVVEQVTRYPAERAPVAEVFGATAEPVLTLITCAGQRDARGEYPDRLVVRARGAG